MKIKVLSLLLLACLCMLLLFFVGPITQDPHYHNFADKRRLWGIKYFGDVVSNLPFVLIGIVGCHFMLKNKGQLGFKCLSTWSGYVTFFTGIVFTGLGSAYYHWQPNDVTLFWDRLPMSISFMALVSVLIAECIDEKAAGKLFLPLIFIGVASVFYWDWTGDLRPYIFVQFYSVLFILFVICLYKSSPTYSLVLLVYILAKVCEMYDVEVWQSTGFVSGHNLKHLLAALAPLFILLSLRKSLRGDVVGRMS